MIFPLITAAYVSRILLEDGIGKVAVAQNFASYFLVAAMLGFPAYGVREIAKVRDNVEEKSRVFTELVVINAISTAIVSAVFIAVIVGIESFEQERALYISCGVSVFLNFINIDWLYQGQEEYGFITARSILIKCLSLLAMLLLVHQKSDYVIYALISSLAIGGNYIFNVIHARKYVHLQFANLKLKHHLEPLFVLAAAGCLGNIYNKIDVTMLGQMNTEAAVGYYTNAHKVILLVVTACQSISAVFMPRFSYYYKNDRKQFEKLIKLGCQILTFLTIPAMAGAFLLSRQIVLILFGTSFEPAAETLRIFMPLAVIRSFGDLLCYQLLICMGKEKKRIPAYAAAALFNVVMNYLLIPIWNQNGAAVASVLSEVLVNGIQLFAILQIVKIDFDKKALGQAIVSTLFMSVGIVCILSMMHSVGLSAFLSVSTGVAIYFLCNFLLKNELIQYGIEKLKKSRE